VSTESWTDGSRKERRWQRDFFYRSHRSGQSIAFLCKMKNLPVTCGYLRARNATSDCLLRFRLYGRLLFPARHLPPRGATEAGPSEDQNRHYGAGCNIPGSTAQPLDLRFASQFREPSGPILYRLSCRRLCSGTDLVAARIQAQRLDVSRWFTIHNSRGLRADGLHEDSSRPNHGPGCRIRHQ
jgi:hypothetical protein